MKKAQEKALFIVFEGLDGVGKTSCAKQVAELIGAHYLTTPTIAVRKHRDEIIDSFNGNQEAAQMFYLATVLAASDEAKACLENGQSVVLDRYFLSTQVYAEFRGSVLNVDESICKLLLSADWTVFLETSLNVRKNRVNKRGCSVSDNETFSSHANVKLTCGYERRMHLPVAGRCIRIDTSTIEVHEIARNIITQIYQH